MRLLVVSDMAHFHRGDGTIVGHGATVRELDALATLFTEVRHVAFVHAVAPPASARPYAARNLTVVALPPTGGDTLRSKVDILRAFPRYAATIARELASADVVHVRCPSAVGMAALAVLSTRSHPKRRWIKYAGDWQPGDGEPLAYRLQRYWLRSNAHRGEVTINNAVEPTGRHLHSFINPTLTAADLERGARSAREKRLSGPVRLMFAGELIAKKGPHIALDAADLLARDHDVQLDIAGTGPLLDELRARATASRVRIHGALAREALDELYAHAHFVVLPSRTEGWPKVLSEGMAFGAVPVATAVGSIPEMLARAASGTTVPAPAAARDIADAIARYVAAPGRWAEESSRGVIAARWFSFDAYLAAVRELLDLP